MLHRKISWSDAPVASVHGAETSLTSAQHAACVCGAEMNHQHFEKHIMCMRIPPPSLHLRLEDTVVLPVVLKLSDLLAPRPVQQDCSLCLYSISRLWVPAPGQKSNSQHGDEVMLSLRCPLCQSAQHRRPISAVARTSPNCITAEGGCGGWSGTILCNVGKASGTHPKRMRTDWFDRPAAPTSLRVRVTGVTL